MHGQAKGLGMCAGAGLKTGAVKAGPGKRDLLGTTGAG